MTRALAVLAVLLLSACGSAVGTGAGSGSLPSDVGGLGVDCGQGGHLAERIGTDSRDYSPGQTITISLTATNTSSAACAYPFGCSPAVEVDNAAGVAAWRTGRVVQPCAMLVRLMMPGESASTEVKVDSALSPGVYSATGAGRPLQDQLGRSYFRVG
jgi:hypothetical protein